MNILKTIMFGAVLAAFTLPTNAQSWLTNGLVAYYPLNADVLDVSGSGNNLTLVTGSLNFTNNRFGQPNRAVFCNFTRLDTQTDADMPGGTDDFTISLWAILDDRLGYLEGAGSPDPHRVFFANQDINGCQLDVYDAEGGNPIPEFYLGGPAAFGGPTGNPRIQFSKLVWHHVVGVRSGNVSQMFVDGSLVASGINSQPIARSAISFGRRSNGDHAWTGNLDDIRIYNRAFSSNEVAQLHALESTPPLIQYPQYPPTNGLVLAAVIDPRAYGLATSEFSDGLAMSGDRIVVQQAFGGGSGALPPANSGLVHVFNHTASNAYNLVTTITTPHTVFDAPSFGISVGIVNQIVYVGSHHTFRAGAHDGTAYLYALNPNANLLDAWTEFPSQSAGYFGAAGRMISDALVVSQGSAPAFGSRAGAFFYGVDGNGARYPVFSLMAQDTDRNVRAIALSTNRCVVRWDSRADTGNNQFLVFDIQRTSSNTVASVSTNCVINRFAEGSPESLACDDQWVAIGDPTAVSGASQCGAVYLYRITGGAANLAATIFPTDLYNGGGFGQAVCLANGFLLVGSPSAPGSSGTNGCVYVFSLSSGGGATLLTRLQPAAAIGSSEAFGAPIVSDGNRVAIGSSAQFQAGTGAVYVYTLEAPPCIPHPATATARVVNGSVVSIQLTDLGCGYTNAPVIRIVGGGGTGATAMTTVTNGYVTSITIIGGGTGYTNAPTVRIASPPFVPSLSIAVSRVKVTLHLLLGHNYVLESSTDLQNWLRVGAQFTAEDELIEQEFETGLTGRFFRTREVP